MQDHKNETEHRNIKEKRKLLALLAPTFNLN